MKQFSLLTALCFFFSTALLQAQESGGESGSGSGPYSSGSAGSSGAGVGVGIVVGENYILKPSDVISIEVYQEVDLNKSARIQGDGSVALALIGKVKVAGMTAGEAQSLIIDLYNRDYLVDPQISLLVVEFSPKVIHVLGSVNSPGVVSIPPDRDLSLTEAIASVRGVSRLGNPKSITIKSVDNEGQVNLKKVNFSRIIQGTSTDIPLKEGDTIWVPERII